MKQLGPYLLRTAFGQIISARGWSFRNAVRYEDSALTQAKAREGRNLVNIAHFGKYMEQSERGLL
jgi:hypothetical protein